jgi:hypothetical protein
VIFGALFRALWSRLSAAAPPDYSKSSEANLAPLDAPGLFMDRSNANATVRPRSDGRNYGFQTANMSLHLALTGNLNILNESSC